MEVHIYPFTHQSHTHKHISAVKAVLKVSEHVDKQRVFTPHYDTVTFKSLPEPAGVFMAPGAIYYYLRCLYYLKAPQ